VSHDSRIRVALAGDDRYVPYLGTALFSLLENRNQARPIDVFIAGKNLSEQSTGKLAALCRQHGCTVTFLAVDQRRLAGVPNIGRFGDVNCYRLLLPDLIDASIEKVLYLDGDVIVLGPLDKLWDIDLEGLPLAAAKDATQPHPDLGLPAGEPGLNSGVLLMNLRYWRENGLSEKAVAFLADPSNRPRIRFPDQDALTVLLRGKWKPVPQVFNAQAAFFIPSSEPLAFDEAERSEVTRSPVVVHYCVRRKPWHYLCSHPLRGVYWEYAKRGPWPRQRVVGVTPKNVARRLLRSFVGRPGRRNAVRQGERHG